MARSPLQEHIVFRWLSLKSTIEYLGEWEMLYNPNFNCTAYPSTCPYDYSAVLLSLPEEWITCGHSSIKRRSRFYYGVSTNMKRMKFMSLSLKVSK